MKKKKTIQILRKTGRRKIRESDCCGEKNLLVDTQEKKPKGD